MKQFSILEAPSEKFIQIALKRMGRDIKDADHASHPQEDFLLSSKKYPIFVVSDGVTLIQYIIDKGRTYPNPSPAGDVARIFSETLIKEAENLYESFNELSISQIFREANKAVEKYNRDNGRTPGSLDFWNNDLFAATGAFVVIKDNKVFWGAICDSFVAHFDKDGSLLFKSPEPNSFSTAKPPSYTGDASDQKARARYVWETMRNGVNDKGDLIGYGVITGEQTAERYLAQGCFELKEGEIVFVLTDGFEEYLELPDFISLFKDWPADIEARFKRYTFEKTIEDPDKYGHERSLIGIRL